MMCTPRVLGIVLSIMVLFSATTASAQDVLREPFVSHDKNNAAYPSDELFSFPAGVRVRFEYARDDPARLAAVSMDCGVARKRFEVRDEYYVLLNRPVVWLSFDDRKKLTAARFSIPLGLSTQGSGRDRNMLVECGKSGVTLTVNR